MPYSFGDVVLVSFPFSSQVAFKKRPAVVVSSNAYNLSRPDLVVMAITSQLHASPNFGEMPVVGWQAAHLLKPSAVKPVFATIEISMVMKTLGCLDVADQTSLRRMIATLLG